MKIKIQGDLLTITTENPEAVGFSVNGNVIPFQSVVDGIKTATVGGAEKDWDIEEAFPVSEEPTIEINKEITT